MSMTLRPRFISLSLLGAALLSGCSGMVRDPGTAQAIQQAYELPSDKSAGSPPSAVSEALLPPIQLQLPGVDARAQAEQRFDIKVRNIHARDFFLSLVEDTPYSMVVDPAVSGSLSLDLKDVTIAEVMRVVRNVHGYDYAMNGQIIQVFPNTIHTRIFEVDYLALTRKGNSLTTTRTGQLSSSGNASQQTSSATDGASSPYSSSISTVSETDFWNGLEASLRSLVGPDEGRSVSVHPHTGMIIVRALPAELRVVGQYLQQSQLTLKRQVILEARILEVTLRDQFQTGINWAGLYQSGNRSLLTSQIGGGSLLSQGQAPTAGGSGVVTPEVAINQVSQAFGGMFGMALRTSDFTAFIELLKTQGDVQVLSSPRVATINNQKAVIKVGSDEYFVTNITSDSSTVAGAGTTNVSVTLESFFSGVALDVTPQISVQGDIVLHVRPAVSDVVQKTKSVTTTIGNLTLPTAASNVRESDTVIRAANDQVVVIGGLMQNVTEDEHSSVPILGDIPLLGALFRHTRQITRKSELVILLKPTVVDEYGEVWQDELNRSSLTIREMGM
ncbi:MAG: pilus (MSHA type) biogenesis protein MshL [Thiohalomonadaceae bacterium]